MRYLWVDRKLEKLLPDLCGFTTTNNHNQHKTYHPHQQLSLQPPTTTATTTTTATNHTKQASQPRRATEFASRACVLAPCACAWVRPLAAFRATSPAHQLTSDTATTGSCGTLAETRNTSASRPPSKQAPRQPVTANTASAPVTVSR